MAHKSGAALERGDGILERDRLVGEEETVLAVGVLDGHAGPVGDGATFGLRSAGPARHQQCQIALARSL